MATIVGVRFRNAGKLYYFSPGQLWPTAGDAVIVETVRGVEYGEVTMPPQEIGDEDIIAPLKPIIRRARGSRRRGGAAAQAHYPHRHGGG